MRKTTESTINKIFGALRNFLSVLTMLSVVVLTLLTYYYIMLDDTRHVFQALASIVVFTYLNSKIGG